MVKLGVICPSEIAFRRFLPALKKIDDICFAGVGVCAEEERYWPKDISKEEMQQTLQLQMNKAERFVEEFGGKIFHGYKEIATSNEIDALYIPLPPALHFKWTKVALEAGKHVLVEKPFTLSPDKAGVLINIAKEKGLALHENYMFMFHDQLKTIDTIVKENTLGDVRLYRISFGFPRRAKEDFRYSRELGGGALMDAGGYALKYAAELLGNTARVCHAQMNYLSDFNVDIYGSGTIVNAEGTVAQIAYGMDNEYKCEIEIWGSQGSLSTGRIFTAPADLVPEASIIRGNKKDIINLPPDDAFRKSIEQFAACMGDHEKRNSNYNIIMKQAKLVKEFEENANL